MYDLDVTNAVAVQRLVVCLKAKVKQKKMVLYIKSNVDSSEKNGRIKEMDRYSFASHVVFITVTC